MYHVSQQILPRLSHQTRDELCEPTVRFSHPSASKLVMNHVSQQILSPLIHQAGDESCQPAVRFCHPSVIKPVMRSVSQQSDSVTSQSSNRWWEVLANSQILSPLGHQTGDEKSDSVTPRSSNWWWESVSQQSDSATSQPSNQWRIVPANILVPLGQQTSNQSCQPTVKNLSSPVQVNCANNCQNRITSAVSEIMCVKPYH